MRTITPPQAVVGRSQAHAHVRGVMGKTSNMENAESLLKELEQYKNRADSFGFRIDQRFRTVEDVSQALADLRTLCEKNLPILVLKAAALTDSELGWLFSENQRLYIDDYDLRLGIFELIPRPSEELTRQFQNFKRTFEVC